MKIDITFPSMLTIVFIVLKLCKVICWKWIWVLSPLWIDIIGALLIMGITLLITEIKYMIRASNYKRDTTYGRRLVWDAKTNTMYGAPESEDTDVQN